jgi:hypothetical protein
MNTPSGLVTANISPKNRRIWNHPFAVISKLLRSQQRIHEIGHHPGRDQQHDDRFSIHNLTLANPVTEANVGERQQEESGRYGREN